jgi:hypothetical protein
MGSVCRAKANRRLACPVVVMQPQDRTTDRVIAVIATAVHGLVTREQLLRAGVTEGEI